MALELPLFKRELIQRAQQRRTYAMRCLVLFTISFVFMIPFVALYYQGARMAFGSLGYGRQLVRVILTTLGTMLYLLGPAMSCGAVSTEKSKQTLPLLLVSRLSPLNIILEKLAAQLVPLLVFLVLSVPLLSVSYLFGGISFAEVTGSFGLLCLLALHLVCISLFWSALMPSSLSAFWMTYATLFVTSFGLMIATSIADEYSPVASELLNILQTPLTWFVDTEYSGGEILFPMSLVVMLASSLMTVREALIAAIPFNLLSLGFLIAARTALIHYGNGRQFSLTQSFRRLIFLPRRRRTTATELRPVDDHAPTPIRPSRMVPRLRSIAWRERQRLRLFGRWYVICFALVLCWYSTVSGPISSASITVCFLIFGLMVVLSLGSRLFATERERQTLDSLLTCPLRSHEILQQKLSGIHSAMLYLLLSTAVLGLFRIILIDFYRSSSIFGISYVSGYRPRTTVPVPSLEWIGEAAQYMLSSLGHALIYMQIVKWVAVWFGLKTNSQVKALLGSLLTVLLICFGPLLVLTLFLVAADLNPDDFPFFFFVSPILIFTFNEFDELSSMYRSSWLPESDMFLILANLSLYGTLAVGLRRIVMSQLDQLLNRRDSQ